MAFEFLKCDLAKVSSRAGRQAIEAAYMHLLSLGAPGRTHAETYADPFRIELRQRLADSGLAEAIAAGRGVLPDIAEFIPWPWRALHSLARPRTVAAQTRAVARYLDWYLAGGRTGILNLRSNLHFAAIAALAIWLFTEMSSCLQGKSHGLGVLIVLLLLTVALNAAVYRPRSSMDKLRMAAVEFYEYLLGAYSDPMVGEVDCSPESAVHSSSLTPRAIPTADRSRG